MATEKIGSGGTYAISIPLGITALAGSLSGQLYTAAGASTGSAIAFTEMGATGCYGATPTAPTVATDTVFFLVVTGSGSAAGFLFAAPLKVTLVDLDTRMVELHDTFVGTISSRLHKTNCTTAGGTEKVINGSGTTILQWSLADDGSGYMTRTRTT